MFEGTYSRHETIRVRLFDSVCILLFIITVIEPIQCQSNLGCAPLSTYNLSQGDWQNENNALKSNFDLEQDGEDQNFTLTVNGPCEVDFTWGVLRGYDYIELFDNETPICTIGKLNNNISHEELSSSFRHNISDIWQHTLIFSHRNNVGLGSATVSNICVKTKFIQNIYASVQPDNGIASSMSCDANMIKNSFAFNVQIDSQEPPQKVELFTLSPNCRNPSIQGEGTSGNYATYGWKDIKLKSNQIGPFQYWFRITLPGNRCPIESERFLGPNITNIVGSARRYVPGDPGEGDCFDESCIIYLKGQTQRTINLNYCDGNNICRSSVSKMYLPDEMDGKDIYFNKTWCRDDIFPAGWEFEII